MFDLVSTFSKEYWDKYGQRMADSYEEHIVDVPLTIYYDPPHEIDDRYTKIKGVSFDDLCGPVWSRFKEHADPLVRGKIHHPPHSPQYELKQELMWDAVRFSYKVLALIDYFDRFFDPKKSRYIAWCDGDTKANGPVSNEWLQTLIPEDCFLSCFQRTQQPGVETGFFIVDAASEHGARWLNLYREHYWDYKLFDLPFWTDCHAHDRSREIVEQEGGKSHNLSPTPTGNVHKKSHINDVISHAKGPRLKWNE